MRQFGRFGPLVGSINESTSSARFMVFAAQTSEMLTYHQIPIKTYYPQDGWAEQDPIEIWRATLQCIEMSIDNLRKLDINPEDIVSIGIANQRETVIMWNYKTGNPIYNALLWMDTRGNEIIEEICSIPKLSEWIRKMCGLPASSYFSAPKLGWLLRHVPEALEAIRDCCCMAGTMDTWLIWNLTGGKIGGLHLTDVTNASRTMLMNVETLEWEDKLCEIFNIPQTILPNIRSSSEIYGYIVSGSLTGVPISGCLGDQQAAMVGQNCLEFGQVECTFGQGAFLLYNTGTSIIRSKNGLVTTVAYKMGKDAPTVYALEGSVANAGSALGWLHSGLGLVEEDGAVSRSTGEAGDCDEDMAAPNLKGISPQLEGRGGKQLLQRLGSPSQPALPPDTEGEVERGVYFVPAFAGLLAPYWRRDAGSVLCGISGNTSDVDILVGALRSCGLQMRALLLALQEDLQLETPPALLGGGPLGAPALLQAQADCIGIPVVRPHQTECWALGAAMAAGSAAGIRVWPSHAPPSPADIYYPTTTEDEREMMYLKWQMTIERSFGWVSNDSTVRQDDSTNLVVKERRLYASISAGVFLMSSCLLMIIASKFKT